MMLKQAAVCAGMWIVVAASGASAAEITGYLSDSACATDQSSAAHAMDWIKTDKFEACVKKCMKEGAALVFVTEDNKILKLDAASLKKAAPHAGHRVRVSGDVAGDTLKVGTIAAIAMVKP